MAIRNQSAVEDALLDFLTQHEEPVRPGDTYGPLADLFDLTVAERQQQLISRAGSAWENLIQWARARLVRRGLLDKTTRGMWSLTETGRTLAAQRGVSAAAVSSPDFMVDGAEADIDAAEGRQALRAHLVRERSRTLVEAFKGSLRDYACQACGFDFGVTYGAIGQNYIEAHHTVPIASMSPGSSTRLEDLIALCSNCHRVVHRNGLMSVEELRTALQRNR